MRVLCTYDCFAREPDVLPRLRTRVDLPIARVPLAIVLVCEVVDPVRYFAVRLVPVTLLDATFIRLSRLPACDMAVWYAPDVLTFSL